MAEHEELRALAEEAKRLADDSSSAPWGITPIDSNDRLRELGMAGDYVSTLCAVTHRAASSDPAADVVYATARQRCEAVRRTWLQRKESEETK